MKQYSILNGSFLVNGVDIEGFANGDDVLTVARREDTLSDVIGADGEMTVSVSGDKSGTMVFRLMQSSDSNKYLSGLFVAQESGVFAPIFAQFKDTVTNDFVNLTQGYITRPADMIRGTGVNVQEWTIVGERVDILHLGS